MSPTEFTTMLENIWELGVRNTTYNWQQDKQQDKQQST